MYAKDLSEPKYEFLIRKRKDVGRNHFNYPNAFIECSNRMYEVYQNTDDYSPSRKRNIFIVFDADIMTNKKFQAIIKELFIRCRKLNISLVFITVLFFCPKRCQSKFNTLIDYENQPQKRITKQSN